MKEIEIQSAIIDFLSLLEEQGKLFFQRTNNTAIFDPTRKRFRALSKGQKKGFPDIIVLIKGRTIGLEIKSTTGRQSEPQKVMQKQFEKQNAEYYVVRSIDDVIRVIDIKVDNQRLL